MKKPYTRRYCCAWPLALLHLYLPLIRVKSCSVCMAKPWAAVAEAIAAAPKKHSSALMLLRNTTTLIRQRHPICAKNF